MTADRPTRGIFAALAVLIAVLAATAKAELTGVIARGQGERLWLVCADVAADKTVTTSVRRPDDPVRGTWAEAQRLAGRAVDAAPMDDRLAVLLDDGAWQLVWNGGATAGPPPPDGDTLRRLAADGDVLWAVADRADGPRLLRWTERDGWSPAAPLPPGVRPSAVDLAVFGGRPWLAHAVAGDPAGAWRLTRFDPAGRFVDGPALPRPLAAGERWGWVSNAVRPTLAMLGRPTSTPLWRVESDNRLVAESTFSNLPADVDVTAVGPTVRAVFVEKGKLRQFAIDDHGRGRAYGPDAIAEPVRVRPPAAEWFSPLLLAVLTVLTLRALRPRTDDPPGVVPTLTPAPIGRRAGATIVDAGPCVAVGAWVFGVFAGPGDGATSAGLPAVMAAYLTLLAYLAHVTACEVAFGRSAGKWLFGLRVVSIDGTAATAGSVVLRNLLRLLEIQLVLPVLVVLMTPTGQRLGDLAARTIVVADGPGVGRKSMKNMAD